jgi:intracellular sulfur oxidation DsrE/DsrF family protein
MIRKSLLILVAMMMTPLCIVADSRVTDSAPYGTSQYHVWPELQDIDDLKIAFDFNFNVPQGIERALYPVSFILKTIQEYGPVTFEPNIVIVSHGSEVVAWARQNYQQYKDIVDRAARLAELGVQFEICVVAAEALGFTPEDFHGFVKVVPLGTYALAYHENNGYAVIPGAATVPAPIINTHNDQALGKLHSGSTH